LAVAVYQSRRDFSAANIDAENETARCDISSHGCSQTKPDCENLGRAMKRLSLNNFQVVKWLILQHPHAVASELQKSKIMILAI
jgi:hypothetical protein